MIRPYGHYQPAYFNDRRRGKERRKFSYTTHIPERRTGRERRLGLERRKTPRQFITIHETGDKSTAKDIMSE
jgi:hypothetical protein